MSKSTEEKPHLVLGNGEKIYFSDTSAKTFMNRMTIMYGTTGAGKTVAVKYILQQLANYIPCVIVICPTNSSHGTYTNLCPLVFNEFDERKIEEIYNLQTQRKELYQAANNIKNITELCNLQPDQNIHQALHLLEVSVEAQILNIKDSNMLFEKKKQKIDMLRKDMEHKKKSIMKAYIRSPKMADIIKASWSKLSSNLRACYEYLDCNMQMCLILDDCASSMGRVKDNSAVGMILNKLFYEGRHNLFTTMILTQSPTTVPPAYRMNAHVSLFLDSGPANNWIENKDNGIDKADKKLLRDFIIPKIFEDKTNHYNLLRDKDAQHKHTVFHATDYTDEDNLKKIGCNSLWELVKPLNAAEEGTIKQNPLIGRSIQK